MTPSLQRILRAVDDNYKILLRAYFSQFQDSQFLTPYVMLFKKIWQDIYVFYEDGSDTLLGVHNSLIVPASFTATLLHSFHFAHQGINKTVQSLRQYYYWPSLRSDVINLLRTCPECQLFQSSNRKEPIKPLQTKEAMYHVSMDLFEYAGFHYLVMVDCFSGFLFLSRLRSLTTSAVTRVVLA